MGQRRQRIKADPSKLVCQGGYRQPDYYRDKQAKCVDCGARFVFMAEEQRLWYEEYGIPHYTLKTRCRDCREKCVAQRATKTAYDNALEALKVNPEAAAAQFEFAKLALQQIEAGVGGRIQAAVSALRKARELNAGLIESHYWLGRCYQQMGNTPRAQTAFMDFVRRAESKKKGISRNLVKDAQKRLQELQRQA